ncbi:hypothetical protein NOC27_335 [Nitrosococcus oceani AFC27]|nr:hypothetical protein NOC27_335 [Nitrosococcus oceani AFC27]
MGGAAFGGFDVAIDDTNYAIWIVGADVKKLNIFLEQECALDPVEWTAVSVDFDSSGSIWIAERKHS